ncbi:hypothetical protein, partial [Streptosporangium sp. NPDC002607]
MAGRDNGSVSSLSSGMRRCRSGCGLNRATTTARRWPPATGGRSFDDAVPAGMRAGECAESPVVRTAGTAVPAV